MKFSPLILAFSLTVTFLPFTLAQYVPPPVCSSYCFQEGLNSDGCTFLDNPCNCRRPPVLTSIYSCSLKYCDDKDRQQVVDNIVSSCKIAKVPVKFDAESGFQADTSSTAPAPSQSATAAGDAANSANGGLSGTQKIGIGVGVPVLVLGMLALVGA